jgi:HD-like signal output (HDOD) protein
MRRTVSHRAGFALHWARSTPRRRANHDAQRERVTSSDSRGPAPGALPAGADPADDALQQQLLQALQKDIASNRLVLPVLPEVALRARALSASPDCSIAELAQLVATEPALATRLLKVVNSAFYRAQAPVETVHAAITRLGLAPVRTLITQLALLQSLQKYGTETGRLLEHVIRHNQAVAARAHAICGRYTLLNPEEAMLAGLVHDVGKLPLLARLHQIAPEHVGSAAADAAVLALHGPIGGMVLRAWGLPDAIVAVAESHETGHATAGAPVDYVDVVTLANLHTHLTDGTRAALTATAKDAVPFRKLGIGLDDLLQDRVLADRIAANLERIAL